MPRPDEQVAPDLIGCLLVKRQASGEWLWGVLVATEAYCQSKPACHGHRHRSPSNDTLFSEPGRFYVYVSYGIHHCVKRACEVKQHRLGLIFSAANGSPSQLPSHCPKNSPFFPPRHSHSYEGLQAGAAGLAESVVQP